MSFNPKLLEKEGSFIFVDNDKRILESPKVLRILKRYNSYFSDFNNLVLRENLTYIELIKLIDSINDRMDQNLEISEEIVTFINQSKYAIEEQRVAGLTIKEYDSRWNEELDNFREILSREITRPLKSQQVQSSFYLTIMKKAANFSVPGSGKTATMYGTYAYLSSEEIDEVDKILVISPLNAFEAWRTEYGKVFGKKRELRYMNIKDYSDAGEIRTNWGIHNLIVLNYESLLGWRLSTLNELIDEKTMIVFDEVHRVKNPLGKRAKNALALGKQAKYHYVLTGTPIPNSYTDIYNFLHLLYDNEYESYFGWKIDDLTDPDVEEVNEKLQPFYWRTTKQDLKVPPADPDNIIKVKPTLEQEELANKIHEFEWNILALYIRLLQASTNPALLTEKINLEELGLWEDELDIEFDVYSALNMDEHLIAKNLEYLKLNSNNMRTPKFEAGINLIKELAAEGKKVLVWGIFVGTMKKITTELNEEGIKSYLVYGQTPKEDREELINDFRFGDVQVLVSNPATLGEAISLHQTVHDAVYFEYNFNLTFMLQSRDRIHRLGLPDDQYTRYYYLMTEGDAAHNSFIDEKVYDRLIEKEEIMLKAIEGNYLVPEVPDDYLEDIKNILGL